MNFGSHADAVVGVTVALVNTVTPGRRQGREYAPPTGRDAIGAVHEALRQGSRRADAPRAGELAAFAELGGAARVVFEHRAAGRPARAAAAVNDLLGRYRPTPRLEQHDGEPWHLHYHGPSDADPTGWGGGIAVALATVLGGEYADRLGVCEAPECDRVYVDVSRNGTRRFCSTACQNRVKAAAHRARLRA